MIRSIGGGGRRLRLSGSARPCFAHVGEDLDVVGLGARGEARERGAQPVVVAVQDLALFGDARIEPSPMAEEPVARGSAVQHNVMSRHRNECVLSGMDWRGQAPEGDICTLRATCFVFSRN